MSKKNMPEEGRRRAVIESIYPSIDGGRFPAKRAEGDRLVVEADVFGDGHDTLRCVLRYRREEAKDWTETEMAFADNDRWRGEFQVGAPGRYRYTVCAWVDTFLSWRKDFAKRVDAEDVVLALQGGAELVAQAAARAKAPDVRTLSSIATKLKGSGDLEARQALVLGDELLALMTRYPDRGFSDTYSPELRLTVDPRRGRCRRGEA